MSLDLLRTLTRGFPRILNVLCLLAYGVARGTDSTFVALPLHLFLGSVVLELTVLLLKGLVGALAPDARWARRPAGAVGCADLARTHNGTDIGMPSGHAAVGGFYAVVLLALALRPIRGRRWLPRALRYGALLPLALLLLVVPPSRLSWRYAPRGLSACRCGCHTPLQIGIGAALGIGGGLAFRHLMLR